VGDEAQDRETRQACNRAQNQQHEQRAGEIERADQRDQVPQRGEPVSADRKRHRAESPERRDADDDADDAEEHLGGLVDGMGDRLADLTEKGDGKTGKDRDQQDLQQIAAGKRPKIAVGDYPEQMGDDALFLRLGDVGGDGFRVDRGRIDVEAMAGLQDFADDQADRQRDRRNSLEVDQRFYADPAVALHITHRGNAMHDGTEDHRRNHHLDQCDEAVAERLQRLAEIRKEISDQYTERDRDENLNIQDLVA